VRRGEGRVRNDVGHGAPPPLLRRRAVLARTRWYFFSFSCMGGCGARPRADPTRSRRRPRRDVCAVRPLPPPGTSGGGGAARAPTRVGAGCVRVGCARRACAHAARARRRQTGTRAPATALGGGRPSLSPHPIHARRGAGAPLSKVQIRRRTCTVVLSFVPHPRATPPDPPPVLHVDTTPLHLLLPRAAPRFFRSACSSSQLRSASPAPGRRADARAS